MTPLAVKTRVSTTTAGGTKMIIIAAHLGCSSALVGGGAEGSRAPRVAWVTRLARNLLIDFGDHAAQTRP